LTKPLTLEDITVLEGLSPRQRRILQFIYAGKTQAQIAKIMKISRQAVHKHVKKFIKWDLIRKDRSLNGSRDIIYKVRHAVVNFLKLKNMGCQPKIMGGVTSPQKPLFSLHRLQLAFHIVNQSQQFTTRAPSFVKTYSPRGWTGYIYLIDNVRIRALPKKVIAELTEDLEFDEPLTAEEATVRAIEKLKSAVDQWLEEQRAYLVDVELSHPYIMNAPEFVFRSRLVKEYIEKLREERRVRQLSTNGGFAESGIHHVTEDGSLWIDDSERGEEAHLETSDPEVATEVDRAIKRVLTIDKDLQTLHQKLEALEAGATAGLSAQNLIDIIQKLFSKLEKRIERLEKLILDRAKERGSETSPISSTQLVYAVASLMDRIDRLEQKLKDPGGVGIE